MNGVSAALIVRDEETVLGRCLGSIAGHVDEIVVVDTGSQDRTREVARGFGARIFDYPWRYDFAKARQFSFERAVGEWVFWIDADDVVAGADAIRASVRTASRDVDAFYWRYVVAEDRHGNPTCELWRERCVRNNGTFRWHGRVHEVLVALRPVVTYREHEVSVTHRPLPGHAADSSRRNLQILLSEWENSTGARIDPRILLHLGFEYMSLGDTAQALEYFERYLPLSTSAEEKYGTLLRIADLLRVEGHFDGACEAAHRASRILPHWPDAYFSLCQSSFCQRDWHRTIAWAEHGRAMGEPESVCVLDPMARRFRWIVFYTNALYQVGRNTEALAWTRRALELCPDDEFHLQNLSLFGDQARRKNEEKRNMTKSRLKHHPTGAKDRISHPCQVYLPTGYGKGCHLPVLWLLHGIGDDESSWISKEKGDIQPLLDSWIKDKLIRPLIVVMPLSFRSRDDGAKRVVASAADFDDLLTKVLLPAVEATYSPDARPEARTIAGLSMGGLLALEMGLSHPDLFNKVGAFSAALRLRGERFQAPSASSGAAGPTVYIACGKQDPLCPENRQFAEDLKALGLAVHGRFFDGGHDWAFWKERLRNFLPLCFPVNVPKPTQQP